MASVANSSVSSLGKERSRSANCLQQRAYELHVLILEEERKAQDVKREIEDTQAQLLATEEERQRVLQELIWHATNNPHSLDTAPLERKIKEFTINVNEKHLEVKRITHHSNTTNLLEAYFASEEVIIEKTRAFESLHD